MAVSLQAVVQRIVTSQIAGVWILSRINSGTRENFGRDRAKLTFGLALVGTICSKYNTSMLRAIFYNHIKSILEKICTRLDRRGVNPSHLTLGGLFINAVGCLLYAYGHFLTGSLVILVAGLFDMLDGALARSADKATKFGAYIDSVVDRYSDFLIFGGLLIYFARTRHPGLVSLVLVVIAGALLTSYTKARAESLILRCDVGWIERPERIIIICTGGIFQFLVPALWVLAFTTHLTALQRIYYTWKETAGKDLTELPPKENIKIVTPREPHRKPREV